MPEVIKDGRVVSDNWQLLREPEGELPAGPVIVPLSRWQEEREALRQRGEVGVWLASDQPPELLEREDIDTLPLIAIDFPTMADGRGFSYGRELREQFDYRGELRAIGEFIRDQLFYLKRCGFNSYALNAPRDKLEEALANLRDFSETYQGAVDEPQPLFRRRSAQ